MKCSSRQQHGRNYHQHTCCNPIACGKGDVSEDMQYVRELETMFCSATNAKPSFGREGCPHASHHFRTYAMHSDTAPQPQANELQLSNEYTRKLSMRKLKQAAITLQMSTRRLAVSTCTTWNPQTNKVANSNRKSI